MNGWRQMLISQIPFQQNKLLLVYDRDDILSDEELLSFLQQKEVNVFTFKDRAQLRIHYEEQLEYSSGEWIYKYVGEGPFTFPFDMLKTQDPVELTLNIAFPYLSLPILHKLDHDVLDEVYKVSDSLLSPLTDSETIEFLLRRVYKLSFDTIETEMEWIAFLIQLHDHRFSIPNVLIDFIIGHLSSKTIQFEELFTLAYSKTKFMEFLQKYWDVYVKNNINQDILIQEGATSIYHKDHLFSYESMRRMIQHYFIEGKLLPIEVDKDRNIPVWADHGVKQKSYQPLKDIHHLGEKIEVFLEKEKIQHKDWIEIINLYGQMKMLQIQYGVGEQIVNEIDKKINRIFQDWMLENYQTLASFSPYIRPAMVHHVLPYMQFQEERKQVLIVLDGMSFVQWKQIKQSLDISFVSEETGVFAWVPTITEISRRSIFHANIPRLQSSISEENAWRQFWKRESIADMHITYENYLAQGEFDESQFTSLQKTNTKKAAIILRNIDALTHGAIQGLEGMYAEIDVWMKSGYLQQFIHKLVGEGYAVYITSDHGNTESIGIGKPRQGSLVETKGERVRIYNDQMFRDEAASQYTSIKWPNDALSKEHYYLLAEAREAFVTKNEHIVSHGGITLEEVIVPFIKIDKRK
ncbi:BREX-3 system phosphatase PglZ [Schinkia azotoformans]|uniref:BREX-3 system phosphatase PglZ n=1 Tax=Schinkia azotoformans TaxID=1454 RepID=UPI002DB72113|nr:BREX-3 system phosphatase PglZ [Schinkia azotoformans]MEC1782116.1 BREX-3 system phosphatase PglZ [Schinkia azotoformans]MED4329566.1 BREX-3 system phosphatase PglZ [Schinkia azotoformans]